MSYADVSSPKESHTEQKLGQKCRHHNLASVVVKTELQVGALIFGPLMNF